MSVPTTATRTGARRRTSAFAAVMVALVAVLSACGARVDTVFTLNDGPTGSRVMTLTLSRSDLDQYVSGGVSAIESSIAAHKPPELEYGGMAVTDESAVATFSLSFDSAETYREKVTAVLAASGRSEPPTIGLTTEDSLFLRGAAIEEDFSSLDLLGWLTAGLVADGAVSADNQGDMLETGDTDVVYRGETTSSYQPLSFSEMTDNGVNAVELTTWLVDDGGYRRAIDIRMPADAYASDPDAFDAYFAGVVPDGGDLVVADTDGWTYGWVVTFTAQDPETVATMTDQVLGSSGTTFTVTEEPDPDNPTRRSTSVLDVVACDAICSPSANAVQSTLIAPSGWQVGGTSADATVSDVEDGVAVTHRPTSTPVEFDHAIPFDSIHVATTIGFDQSVNQTVTFNVADADVAAAGDGFERLLTVDGAGEVTTSSSDGMTSYVVTFTADDSDDYNAQLSALSPGGYLSIAPVDGDGFWWSHHRIDLDLDLAASVASGGVKNGITYDTQVPFGHAIAEQDSAVGAGGSIDGRTATSTTVDGIGPVTSLAVSGPTVAFVVLIGVLALLGVIAVAGLLIFRKRVGALIDAWSRSRASRAAARAAAPATSRPDVVGVGAHDEPRCGPPVPGPHGAETFTEAEIR